MMKVLKTRLLASRPTENTSTAAYGPIFPASGLMKSVGMAAATKREKNPIKIPQASPGEEHDGISHRAAQVGDHHAQHKSEANPYRKSDRHAGDRNRRYQQDIGGVEDDASHKGREKAVTTCLAEILEKTSSRRTQVPQGQAKQKREQKDPDGVVPVEKLKPPVFLRQLLGIGPRTPAKHGDDAKQHCHGVTF